MSDSIQKLKPLIGLNDHQFDSLYVQAFEAYQIVADPLLFQSDWMPTKMNFIHDAIRRSLCLVLSTTETLIQSRDAWTYSIYLCSLAWGTTEAIHQLPLPARFDPQHCRRDPGDAALIQSILSTPTESWLVEHQCLEAITAFFNPTSTSCLSPVFNQKQPERQPKPLAQESTITQSDLLLKFTAWLNRLLEKKETKMDSYTRASNEGWYLCTPFIFELFEKDTLMSAKYTQRSLKKSTCFLRSPDGNLIHKKVINDKIQNCLFYIP